jgi:hypothetical protein
MIPSVDISQPQVTAVVNGGLYKSGMVYYAYQLYDKSGAETIISPVSNGVSLVESPAGLNDTGKYLGSPVDQMTGKAVRVKIPLIDNDFDRIRLYSIFYDQAEGSPVINIVADKRTRQADSLEFIDDGYSYVGTLTLQELRDYNRFLFSCKDIALKDNRLICANLLESRFDIDYDARAYRHDSSGNFSYDGNVVAGSEANYNAVDEFADCDAGTYATYKYDASGDVGGEGVNIKYTFDNVLLSMDKYTDSIFQCAAGKTFQEWSSDLDSSFVDNEYFTNYASPINASQLVGYKRGETYRFGIVFMDSMGRVSPAKWIGDIKMPEQDEDLGNSTDNTTGESFTVLRVGPIPIEQVDLYNTTTMTTLLDEYVVSDTGDDTHTFTLTFNGITATVVIGGGGCDVPDDDDPAPPAGRGDGGRAAVQERRRRACRRRTRSRRASGWRRGRAAR